MIIYYMSKLKKYQYICLFLILTSTFNSFIKKSVSTNESIYIFSNSYAIFPLIVEINDNNTNYIITVEHNVNVPVYIYGENSTYRIIYKNITISDWKEFSYNKNIDIGNINNSIFQFLISNYIIIFFIIIITIMYYIMKLSTNNYNIKQPKKINNNYNTIKIESDKVIIIKKEYDKSKRM